MLVFGLLLSLTSGLHVVPDNLHATFIQALNSILPDGPAIDEPVPSAYSLASAAMIRPLRAAFTDSAPLIDGNPEEAVWSLARPIEIHPSPESDLTGGGVTVRVRVHPFRITLEN